MKYIALVLLLIPLMVPATISVRGRGRVNIAHYYVFLLIVLFSGFVTYTPDWDGYTHWMEYQSGRDYLFKTISDYYTALGKGYAELHLTFVCLYTFLCVYLASRLSPKNGALISAVYVSIVYLFYTTQIRFFLAYFLFFFSCYELIIRKSWVKSLIIFIIAVSSHLAILGLMPIACFAFIARSSPKKLPFFIIAFGILLFLVTIFAVEFLANSGDLYFTEYLSVKEVRPTFLGSTFIFGPYIASAFFLWFAVRKELRWQQRERASPPEFELCWVVAVGALIYLPIAFIAQIIGHRFIVASLIFHLLAWSYILGPKGFAFKSIPTRVSIFLLGLCFFLSTYIIPDLLGHPYYSESTRAVFESNSLF